MKYKPAIYDPEKIEILFRVYDTVKNCYVILCLDKQFDGEENNDNVHDGMSVGRQEVGNKNIIHLGFYQKHGHKVERSTVKKDIAGNWIFEGDVLENVKGEYVVVYDHSDSAFWLVDRVLEKFPVTEHMNSYRILGTIHDNEYSAFWK